MQKIYKLEHSVSALISVKLIGIHFVLSGFSFYQCSDYQYICNGNLCYGTGILKCFRFKRVFGLNVFGLTRFDCMCTLMLGRSNNKSPGFSV